MNKKNLMILKKRTKILFFKNSNAARPIFVIMIQKFTVDKFAANRNDEL
jgi:hypothetical protein